MRAARLSVTEGNERGREIPLKRESVVLGRSGKADFTIDDGRMSRHHARISSRDGGFTIEDLGSANGTRVNGVDVKAKSPLRHGDEIEVGSTTMRFELLDEKSDAKPPAPATPPRPDADGGLVGLTIGGYEVLAEIGRGAVGFVYRARQTSLDREVALKILAPKYAADPAFVRRFVDESAAAARLSHPNVVQVYDAGSDRGYHFFSMELMHGGSLYHRLATLRGERFSVHAALSAVLDAARGMQFSETCGIIHRDIKPDNLMLTEDGVVKIGDLGIAVHAGDAHDKRMGTPAYLAPEVVAGNPPSAASDIYGLGATLYRLLAGRKPYDDVGAVETLRRVREGPPPPLESVAPSLPPEVYELVGRMMARRPQDRPKSAGEIVETIERMRFDREVKKAAKAAAAGPRSPLWAVAYVLVVGVGLGAVVLLVLREKPQEPETPPAAPPVVVETQTERAETDPATALAREAIAALIRKETAIGPVESAKKDEWRALAAEYDAFPEKFPDATRQRATARKRSAWITDALARLAESDKKAADATSRTWSERRAKIEAFESAGQWAEALDLASQTWQDPAFTRTFERVEGSRQFLLTTPDRVRLAVRRSLDAALTKARSLLATHDVTAAVDVVAQWAEKTRPHADADPHIDAAVREADAFADSAKGDADRGVADALAADVAAMTTAIADSAACRGDRLALRFADARAALTNFLPRAKSSFVRRRVERRLARLDAAESAWNAFIERFARGEVVADGTPIAWAPDVPPAATAKLALGKRPTTDGFSIDLVVQQASARKSVAWVDLSVGVVSSNLLAPAAGRISGADAAGLMWLCVELRQPLVASDCLSRAGLPADEGASARFEIDAVRDWARASASGDVSKWRLKYVAYDVAMVIDAAARPTATELFGEAAVKAYVDSGGVEPR